MLLIRIKKKEVLSMWKGFEQQFGIDLGTSYTLIYQKGKGIILQEPTVLTIRKETGEIVAFGEEAAAMIGRTPMGLQVIHPLKNGVIANFDMAKAMLRHYFQISIGKHRWVKRSNVVISIPSNITSVQKRAVEETAVYAGAKSVTTIEEPLAAALGAGLPVYDPIGNLIIHIGGGTTEIAVISLGRVVVSNSHPLGGLSIDRAFIEFIKRKYNLIIGERTAENLKKQIGSALSINPEEKVDFCGHDLITGVPKSLSILAKEFTCIFDDFVRSVVDSIRLTLEECPPELAGDIMVQGLMLSGGGSLLQGFAHRLQEETQIPVYLAEQPMECVALGTGKILSEPSITLSHSPLKSFRSKRKKEKGLFETVDQE
jgi:rod shape-determining protein MreB and related proteins